MSTAGHFEPGQPYECQCGALFANDVSAYKHRDGKPISERPKHTISRVTKERSTKLAAVPAPPPDTPGGIVWQDPPRVGGRGPVLTETIVAALKANPGRWALIKHYPGHTSATGAAKKVRTDHSQIDAVGRRPEQGGSDLYCRWNPTKSPAFADG